MPTGYGEAEEVASVLLDGVGCAVRVKGCSGLMAVDQGASGKGGEVVEKGSEAVVLRGNQDERKCRRMRDERRA